MKKFISAVYVFLFCCVCISSASTLDTYRKHFKKKLENIFWSHGNEIKKLNIGYEKTLENMKAEAVRKGNLDLVEAAVKEKNRFSANKTVSEENINANIKPLGNMQKMYIEARHKLKLKWADDVLTLAKEYDKALQALQVNLTRQENLEAARAVRKERKELNNVQDVADARKFIGQLEPEEKQAYVNKYQDDTEKKNDLPETLKKDLVLYYSFERNKNHKVTDKSGNNHDGRVHGAKWNMKGKAAGGCYEFDGNDDYITATGYKGITGDPTPEHTVSIWFKIDNFKTRSHLFSWGSESPWGAKCLVCIFEDSSRAGRLIEVATRGGTKRLAEKLKTGVWHHYAIVYPGNDGSPNVLDYEVYLNGVKQTTFVLENSQHLAYAAGEDFSIGWDPYHPSLKERSFHGLIDEVRVYQRALSAAEVLQLYKADK